MPDALHVGARSEAGWTTSADLAGAGLHEALASAGRSLETDRLDIQGQRVIEIVTWWLAQPAAHALLEHRLPDLSPNNTRLWMSEDEPPDGIGTLILEHRHFTGELIPRLHHMLDAHLTPLIEAVNEHTKRPRKALQRGITDRLAGALVWVAQTKGLEARGVDLARAAVEGVEIRTLRTPDTDMLLHVREGCCLYYRIPGKVKCWSCPLLQDEERRALVAGG